MPGAGFGVAYSRPTDVMGRRIGAYAIDVAIASAIFFIMFFMLASSPHFSTAGDATDFCDNYNNNPDVICVPSGTTAYVLDSTEFGAVMLAEAGFVLVNFILLTGLTGFSLGKLMTGVRVVHRATGQRCGVARALLRTLLLVIPDLLGAVGVIVAATTDDHRRVGDMAANTLVVHKRALGQRPQPLYAPATYAPGGYLGVAQPPPPGYGHAAPPSPWAPSPSAPAPPWTAPAAPAPTGSTSWPDFGAARPTDPDATSVFDTASPTDTNAVISESATSATPNVEAKPAPLPAGEGAEAMPGVGAPHWDTNRNTYVQWDPELAAWMQWDYEKNEWHSIK